MSSIFSLSSCDIDVIPQDRYAEELIWSDPSTIELYINGMYNEFKTFQFGSFPGLGYGIPSSDALADLMKFTSNSPGNGTINILISNSNQFSASNIGLNYWSSGYSRIRRLNEFIDGLYNKSQVKEEELSKYEAEARFIRAYSYHWLAKVHGSLIILKDLKEYSNKNNPRVSEEDVYDFIIDDLKFAINNLPKTHLRGRATKGAAYALLSRVALYAGSIAKYDLNQFNQDPLTGISSAKANEYFTISKEASEAVVSLANEGLYALDPNFASIFTNKNTKEGIFILDFARPNVTHQYDLYYAPPKDALGNTQVSGVPTAELVDEFEMNDGAKFSWENGTHAANPYINREPRFYATIIHNGTVWKSRTINTSTGDNTEGFTEFGVVNDPKRTVSGYYAKKLLDPTNTSFVTNQSQQTWLEMRYAEVILNLAEARAQLGDLVGAASSVNLLRTNRGNLKPVTFSSNANAMQGIEHERIVELALEGHRFWDLRRWRKAHLVLNNSRMTGHKILPNGSNFKYEKVDVDNVNRSFSGRLYYLPIPESEVTINSALTQIQGW